VSNVRLLHPDWEYIFFDDDDIRRFVGAEFPEYQAAFDWFPYAIQRVDFFRYLAVYRLGGFYLDLDVFLCKSLIPLLGAAAVFPFEELTLNRFLREGCSMDWEIGNYAFGAAAGHPFLKAVIENCIRSQTEPEWTGLMMQGIPKMFRSDFEVLNTTGPGLLSRTLVEYRTTARDCTILFPEDVCDPQEWHQFGDYGVHLMAGSWRSGGGALHQRLMRGWETWTRTRTSAGSRALGPRRTLPAAPDVSTAPAAPADRCASLLTVK